MARMVIVKPSDVKSHAKYLYNYKLKRYLLYVSLVVNVILTAMVIYGR